MTLDFPGLKNVRNTFLLPPSLWYFIFFTAAHVEKTPTFLPLPPIHPWMRYAPLLGASTQMLSLTKSYLFSKICDVPRSSHCPAPTSLGPLFCSAVLSVPTVVGLLPPPQGPVQGLSALWEWKKCINTTGLHL